MTELGSTLWKSVNSHYGALTLAGDGDGQYERYGCTAHQIDKRLPNYEQFWKFHICPATTRPNGVGFRNGVDDTISLMAQRSYTVLAYILEALEFLEFVIRGDLGPRRRNAYITLMYAGNAMQIFTELQGAVYGKRDGTTPRAPNGKRTVEDRLDVSLAAFSDWGENWEPQRSEIIRYRNHLTHQGWFYTVEKGAPIVPYVLARQHLPKEAFTWIDADRDYDACADRWVKLTDTCVEIVNETIEWLNAAYGEICRVLTPQLVKPEYQRLWGWQPGMLPTLTVPSAMPAGSGSVPTSAYLTGSTAARVEDSGIRRF